jgi:hypothetical protein
MRKHVHEDDTEPGSEHQEYEVHGNHLCLPRPESASADRDRHFRRQFQLRLPRPECGVFLAICPAPARYPGGDKKKERRGLTSVHFASHRRPIHWLDLFREVHNAILAGEYYKTVNAVGFSAYDVAF